MNETEERIHRTWIELLKDTGFTELASAILDAEIEYMHSQWDQIGLYINLPPSSYSLIKQNQNHQELLKRSLKAVAQGRISDQNGNENENPIFEFRLKLLPIEDGWKEVMRQLIVNARGSNQASISERAFTQSHKHLYEYNGMKFASKSEIRIAQELELRHILFFPLPLAVRYETGHPYQDYREPDFLICQDGVFGILEVSYHPDRFEKDSEKDVWFKKAGILCIQHYTAERCYREPEKVVEEFLEILIKHKL